MPETPTPDLLAAIDIVDKLAASVEHLHPSYTTQRVGLKWLREHAIQIESNGAIGAALVERWGGPCAPDDADTVAIGRAVRTAVVAAGGRIEFGDTETEVAAPRGVYDEIRAARTGGMGHLRSGVDEVLRAAVSWIGDTSITPFPHTDRAALVKAAALLVVAIEAMDHA